MEGEHRSSTYRMISMDGAYTNPATDNMNIYVISKSFKCLGVAAVCLWNDGQHSILMNVNSNSSQFGFSLTFEGEWLRICTNVF